MSEARERAQGTGAQASTTTLGESLLNDVSEEVKDLRDEAAAKVGQVGTQVRTAAKKSAGDLLDKASALVSETASQVEDVAAGQKAAGVDRLGRIASAVREAADAIEEELAPVAPYVRAAADEIDTFADALETKSVGELIGVVSAFARRQPATFLGIAAATGFAAVRILKVPVRTGEHRESAR